MVSSIVPPGTPHRPMNILVVEDEKPIARIIGKGLKEEGFLVETVDRGDEVLPLLSSKTFDAVVLDIMLPGLDGLAVVRALRKKGNRIPILLVSARGAAAEKIEGLDLGADDYLAKPFSVDELAARLRALIRRAGGENPSLCHVGDLTLDLPNRHALRNGQRIELTSREFLLLECLMRSPGHAFTRSQVCERVWNYNFDPGTNLVDVYIQRLRRKIDDGAAIRLIRTVRGIGYRIGEPSPESEPESEPGHASPSHG